MSSIMEQEVSSTTFHNGDDGSDSDSGTDTDESLDSDDTDETEDAEESEQQQGKCTNDPQNCCCGRSIFLTQPAVAPKKKGNKPRIHYFKCSVCGIKYRRQAIYRRHFKTRLHKDNMVQCLMDDLLDPNATGEENQEVEIIQEPGEAEQANVNVNVRGNQAAMEIVEEQVVQSPASTSGRGRGSARTRARGGSFSGARGQKRRNL